MATPVADLIGLTGNALIDGLTQGGSWTFSGGGVLTYSFNLNFDVSPGGGFMPGAGGNWTTPFIDAFMRATTAWSSVANIGFQQISSGNYTYESNADIAATLTGDDLSEIGGAALGVPPDRDVANELLAAIDLTRTEYPRPEGDLFFDNFYQGYQYLYDGGFGYETMVHELGHALGLKHPDDDGGNSRPTFAMLGIVQYDSARYTIMNTAANGTLSSGNGAGPMPLDILAIQHIYGANMSHHVGNDVYQIVSDSNNPLGTIWDAGGTDTVDASALSSSGVTVDLRPGVGYVESPFSSNGYTAIAYNVTIENALGGMGNDTLIGNEAANRLDGQGGSDFMRGGAGNDTYAIDILSDLVIENPGEGLDIVNASVSITLPANVENFVAAGTRPVSGTGNELDNEITGNESDNTLSGLAGSDTLTGGLGNDDLNGGDGLDMVAYPGPRTAYTITGRSVLTVTGPEGTDSLRSIERLQFSDATVQLSEVSLAPIARLVDFSGDGKSDFVIRHVEGTIEYRLMDGVNFAGYRDDPIPTYWSVVSTNSDFNADGKSDLVIRHDEGILEYRLMDGVNLAGFRDDFIPTYWSVVSTTSDFNADGKSDVVIRHDEGIIEYRLMDGVNLAGFRDDFIPSYWKVLSTDSDFNADGKSDVVIRHDEGIIEYRLMDGVNLLGYRDDFIPTAWEVVSTDSDFNADGKSDVVLRHDSGIIEYRLMDGMNLLGYRDDFIPTYWKIVSTDSDFNGDGKSDVVLRHDDGTIEYRLMDGVNMTAYRDDPIPNHWSVVSTESDFNGDAKTDVVLRHDNGTIEYRLMDGVNMTAFLDDPIPAYWSVFNNEPQVLAQ